MISKNTHKAYMDASYKGSRAGIRWAPCWHCRKNITLGNSDEEGGLEYYTINRKVLADKTYHWLSLYFHIDCFHTIAGDTYEIQRYNPRDGIWPI
jgi:hypothetical protein